MKQEEIKFKKPASIASILIACPGFESQWSESFL